LETEKKRGRKIMAFLQFQREKDPRDPRSLNEPLPLIEHTRTKIPNKHKRGRRK
jgi:hypothetical protein